MHLGDSGPMHRALIHLRDNGISRLASLSLVLKQQLCLMSMYVRHCQSGICPSLASTQRSTLHIQSDLQAVNYRNERRRLKGHPMRISESDYVLPGHWGP